MTSHQIQFQSNGYINHVIQLSHEKQPKACKPPYETRIASKHPKILRSSGIKTNIPLNDEPLITLIEPQVFPGFPPTKIWFSVPKPDVPRRAAAVAALVGVAPRHDAAVAQQSSEGSVGGGDPWALMGPS